MLQDDTRLVSRDRHGAVSRALMATVQPHRVRAGRGVELGLLVLALVIGIASYALVGIGTTDKVPPDVIGYGIGMAVLAIGIHLVLRWRAPFADPVILPITVALNGIGLAMIYRIDFAYAARGRDDTGSRDRQLVWTAISVVLAAAVLILLRDHRTLRRYTYTAGVVGLALVLLPLVPGVGRAHQRRAHLGARRRRRVPARRVRQDRVRRSSSPATWSRTATPSRWPAPRCSACSCRARATSARSSSCGRASVAVLVLERDLGTSLLFFGLFVAMLYLATERLSLGDHRPAACSSSARCLAATRVLARRRPVRRLAARVRPGGVRQGLRRVRAAGARPVRHGQRRAVRHRAGAQGRPDLVPFAESDFIVASLGEELGLTGPASRS